MLNIEKESCKRRRSSLCPSRISLLPSDVNSAEESKPPESKIPKAETISACILSTFESLNTEFLESDGILLFSEDRKQSNISTIEYSLKTLKENQEQVESDEEAFANGNDNEDEKGEGINNNNSNNVNIDDLVHYKERRIADINEERHRWDILLRKFEADAAVTNQKPNKTTEYKDVPATVKNKAEKCQYLVDKLPFEDILNKCTKYADKTFLTMEDCVAKTHQLGKIQKHLSQILDRQYEKFTLNLQEKSTSANDSDIGQIIENRVAIVSPANDK